MNGAYPLHMVNPPRYPSFGILIQILQFYQAYRALEQTLFMHDESAPFLYADDIQQQNQQIPFRVELTAPSKQSEPC